MRNIVFTTRLTEADWDDALRGWRCPPLAVPGAIVEALYVDGNRVDTARYEVLAEHSVIRWTPPDQPKQVAASIKLTEELTLGKETDHWKQLAIVLPVIATIAGATISGAATYFSRAGGKPAASASIPPDPVPTGANVTQTADNSSLKRARSIKLGEDVVGLATQQEGWFRFAIPDTNPRQVKVSIKNLYKSGSLTTRVFNSREEQIQIDNSYGGDVAIRFISPTSAEYYVSIVASSKSSAASYQLSVSD